MVRDVHDRSHSGRGITGDVQRSVLLVDDDRGTRDTFTSAARIVGIEMVTAASGAEAIREIHSRSFETAIVDVRLPDINGLELVRRLSTAFPRTRTIVISGFLTTEVTVQAVKLGAFAVLDKPIDTEELEEILFESLNQSFDQPPTPVIPNAVYATHLAQATSEPKSVYERWAFMILRAQTAEDDPRTLDRLAETIAVSVSTFCEVCRLVDVQPHVARDLARIMRAIRLSHEEHCHPKVFLNVSHRRTLQSLLRGAGLIDAAGRDVPGAWTSDEFFSRQRFISQDNKAFHILRTFAVAKP